MALMNVIASRGHLLHSICRRSAGRANASIVERHNMMLRRQPIDDPRVPIVQDGGQMDEAHKRHSGIVCAEFPVSERDIAALDRFGRHVPPSDIGDLRRLVMSSSFEASRTAGLEPVGAVSSASVGKVDQAKRFTRVRAQGNRAPSAQTPRGTGRLPRGLNSDK